MWIFLLCHNIESKGKSKGSELSDWTMDNEFNHLYWNEIISLLYGSFSHRLTHFKGATRSELLYVNHTLIIVNYKNSHNNILRKQTAKPQLFNWLTWVQERWGNMKILTQTLSSDFRFLVCVVLFFSFIGVWAWITLIFNKFPPEKNVNSFTSVWLM